MDIIQMARDLGAELQRCDQYAAYHAAKNLADNDAALQQQISEFNLKKLELSMAAQHSAEKPEKLTELNEQVSGLYNKIMTTPSMMAFNTTKLELDDLLNFVEQIIVGCANGEDPYAIEKNEGGGCSGSCSSCSGC